VQVEHVERPIDNFVQVFISPHSNYWQVALAFYLRMYRGISVRKSQISEALHIAQFPLRTRHQSHYYL